MKRDGFTSEEKNISRVTVMLKRKFFLTKNGKNQVVRGGEFNPGNYILEITYI